tara:strand:- start:8400 stop:9056 length:657 start_codon:yes stop_codon:yes gene_type:complete
MIDSSQIKAAKALIGWSQDRLAEESGISKSAIAKIEAGLNIPREDTLNKFKKAFERGGIEFIDEGVRRRRDKVQVWEGPQAVGRLLDDIISTLKDVENPELMIFGLDEVRFMKICPIEKLSETVEQRRHFGVKQRVLLAEGDTNFVGSSLTYRWVKKEYFVSTPTYVYGTKVATLLWTDPTEIIVVDNEMFSDERRRNFNMMWSTALIPSTATDADRA